MLTLCHRRQYLRNAAIVTAVAAVAIVFEVTARAYEFRAVTTKYFGQGGFVAAGDAGRV